MPSMKKTPILRCVMETLNLWYTAALETAARLLFELHLHGTKVVNF